MRVLLAGSTGQLGAGVREVAAAAEVELIPVVRPRAGLGARARAGRLFAGQPEVAAQTLEGDVRLPRWGLDEEQVDALASRVDAVLNVAAETNWAADTARLSAVNHLGAVNGQALAEALRARHGRCGAYVYASSIYVAGDLSGSVPETPLPANAGRTIYEQSKWLAERSLLHGARQGEGVPLGIARMGGLLGSSRSGETAKRNSLYLLADRWEELPASLLPVVSGGRVDMLPRDIAAAALLGFLAATVRKASQEPQLVHVCAGESAPTTEALVAALRSGDRFGAMAAPRTLSLPAAPLLYLTQNVDRFFELPERWRNMIMGLRYLAFERIFERARLARLLRDPLPSASLELIASLAFGLPEARPEPWEPAAELARFAG
jgi:thioester reductase-like protein